MLQLRHSEWSVSGVEESSHQSGICNQISAKILQLALLAQGDNRFLRHTSVYTHESRSPENRI